MNKTQVSKALELAKSDIIIREDIGVFDGYGLVDFKPINCSLESIAALIRWECVYFNGNIDTQALNDLIIIGRKKFIVY